MSETPQSPERLKPARTKPGRAFPLLLVQLVAANVAVAGTVALMVYWAFRRLTDVYFERLMKEFNISPTKLNAMFVEDVESTFLVGVGVALAVGFTLSLLLTKAILRPLGRLAAAAHNIAGGDLKTRVTGISGELEPLAWHFNAMAGALERQEESRRQLMRDLSHELRTPLTNLTGYLEGLEDGVFEPDPQVLGVLSDEVARLNLLINDLTQLSGAEEIAAHLTFEDVDLPAEIERAFVGHQGGLMERGIGFDIERPAKPVLVRADCQRLRQVLNNVVANIVQYTLTPDGRSGSGGACVRVRIEEAGPGRVTACFENPAEAINKAHLARLFDRLYRVDQTRSGDAFNAGLGLSIVKQLVEAQGGTVRAGYDKGCFQLWLRLPLV